MRKFLDSVGRIGAWCTKHKAIIALTIALVLVIIPLQYSFASSHTSWTDFAMNPIDTTMLTLAKIIQVLTGGLGQLTLLLIQSIVIPILGYNGFYNSHITNLGWSLVRDVVNMFVVIILIVIAMMTVIGYEKANWTQQLPKLFISIVLVNFSKLICGFLIDVSQVIMFTFVNAIVSIAAGNFAAMLSLNTYGQFAQDFIVEINKNGSGVEAFQFLVGAYLQFIVLLGILGVIFLLAAAFVWRIIILWIVIIMSPLAFFMIGVKDIFHAAESSYKEWWKKFTSALMFGPIMVFFLWLALAASSGSNLAQTEDFPMPESQTDAGIPLTMFELDNFLGMFLALAILLGGMQQASASAAGMGGFASKVLSEGAGIGLLKGIARPLNSGKRLGKAAFEGGKIGGMEVPGIGKIAPNYSQKFGKGLANIGTGMTKALGGGLVAGMIGGSLAGAGASIVGIGKEERKKRNKGGAEDAEHMTDDQKTAYNLARADVVNGNEKVTNGKAALKTAKDANDREGIQRAEAMIKQGESLAGSGRGVLAQYKGEVHGARSKALATTVAAQDKLRKDLEENYKKKDPNSDYKALAAADYGKVLGDQLAYASTKEGAAFMQLSAEEKELIQDTYTANPHLIEPEGGRGAYGDEEAYIKAKADSIETHYKARADKRGKVDFKVQNAAAYADKAVQAANKKYITEDGKTNAWDYIADGAGRNDQRKAMAATITADDVRDTATSSASVKTLVSTGMLLQKDADGVGSTRSDAVLDVLQTTKAENLEAGVHGAASASFLANGKNLADVFGSNVGELAQEDTADTRLSAQMDAMLAGDATNARHVDLLIPEGAPASVLTELVAKRTNRNMIRQLENTRMAGGADGKKAEASLAVRKRALLAEHAKAVSGGDAKRAKEIEEMSKDISTGGRYGERRTSSAGGGSGGSGSSGGGSGSSGTGAPAAPAPASSGPDEEFLNGRGNARPAPTPRVNSAAPRPPDEYRSGASAGRKPVVRQVRGSGTPAPAPSAAPAPAPAPFTPKARPPLRFQDEPTPAPDVPNPTGGRYDPPAGGAGGGDPFR